METLANNFQFGDGKAAFDEALSYFTAIGDSPNNAIDLLMSGVVKVMESVALFALDAVRGVIATLMDLIKLVVESFKQALLAEREIPVLSDIQVATYFVPALGPHPLRSERMRASRRMAAGAGVCCHPSRRIATQCSEDEV